ncbi:MAG: hypothetical protein CV090_15410 [Nitrospira sp. WS238]|nr:hypothetical protein [Nitrospira sp. WS238]
MGQGVTGMASRAIACPNVGDPVDGYDERVSRRGGMDEGRRLPVDSIKVAQRPERNRMRRVSSLRLLGALLLAACTGGESPSGSTRSTPADWSRVGETEAYSYYADRGSVRKADETVTMSDLFDYKAVHTEGGMNALSKITLREYDCQNRKSQAIKTTWHGGQMGSGAVVRTTGVTGQLMPVASGTATEAFMQVACGP